VNSDNDFVNIQLIIVIIIIIIIIIIMIVFIYAYREPQCVYKIKILKPNLQRSKNR